MCAPMVDLCCSNHILLQILKYSNAVNLRQGKSFLVPEIFQILHCFVITKNGNMELPIKPDESDCCNSGCNPCILDVYEEQLKKFQKTLKGAPKSAKNCLSLTSFTVFRLVNIQEHTRDCNLYTFEYVRHKRTLSHLENEDNLSVLYEPGQHLVLKGNFNGETFQKAYTPIFIENLPETQFTVLVKLYEKGTMSRYLRGLSIGCETLWRGPYGDFRINYEEKHVLFIAQGTAVAPFYTIICDILNNEDCYTFLRLFFCCNSKNVLLREELYQLMQFWNFKYELFVSGDTDNFAIKYNEVVYFSRLDLERIKWFLKEARGCKVWVCGDESFCENVKNMLVQCGICIEDIRVF